MQRVSFTLIAEESRLFTHFPFAISRADLNGILAIYLTFFVQINRRKMERKVIRAATGLTRSFQSKPTHLSLLMLLVFGPNKHINSRHTFELYEKFRQLFALHL